MLIVDDDPEIRRVLSDILRDAGYEVRTATDAEHAFRSAVALAPDLILLDVYVPEPSFALRFAQNYRDRLPAEERAPIIALSGVSDIEKLSQQLGASGFIRKPFEVDELLRVLDKWLTAGAG